MARRTKQEAQATRQQLLEAAIRVFAEKGVSRTSLQDIAQRAGVSRGAIYWHFANKADLFDAMMESAVLPMEQALQQIGHVAGQDPLHELEGALLFSMRSIASDARIRAIFEIATLKVEYVDELLTVKARYAASCADATREIKRSLQDASTHHGVLLRVPVAVAAQGLQAMMTGLVHTWILAPDSYALVEVSQAAIHSYLLGLGFVRPDSI